MRCWCHPPTADGLQVSKIFGFQRGDYRIHVSYEITNPTTQPWSGVLVGQIKRDGSKDPSSENHSFGMVTFLGGAWWTPEKNYNKLALDKFGSEPLSQTVTGGWVAMVQHYFASAWILPEGVKRTINLDGVALEGVTLADCCYRATMIAPMGLVAPGAKTEMVATLFAGPQEEKKIEAITPGLGLVKDYGWFAILAKPLYALLYWLHTIINNWGWSIIALVVLLKAAFYWFNAKAYSSMAKMKAVGPRIQAMRERLKDKPQEMQQEMMKIYREEKINPMGGCFPIMIQIPVFIALYWVLLSSVEMRNAPWLAWINDLSTPDPFYILPLVMAVTTMIQTALNPLPPDPLQAKLMWMMPLVFSVMFFFFPSGLVLYWITNNILTIAQQAHINKRMGVPLKFNMPKFK